MATFQQHLNVTRNEKLLIQGNAAFALGVIHVGFTLADGYPGTPSTEVLENLRQVPELIKADWSVNEAVAVGVGVGNAMAGAHGVVTMKVPGLFQAADVIASASHTQALNGALVLFVATDHLPSSSQYLVDARPFLESIMIPVLEPRNHQDLYDFALEAKTISTQWKTPAVVLCSSALCHAEGFITPSANLMPEPRSENGNSPVPLDNVLLPADARLSYDQGVMKKIPAIRRHFSLSPFIHETESTSGWGVICTGEAACIVDDALSLCKLAPKRLRISGTSPLPVDAIKIWRENISGPVFLFEDGGRYIEGHLRQATVEVIGKEQCPTITHWSPDLVLNQLRTEQCTEGMVPERNPPPSSHNEITRPPVICAGCPYKAISLEIQKLKKSNTIDLVFGDIGCSTLLYFQNALDINLCMGASESMRQGYILAHPERAARVLSLIGDSSECHSGMDATRNAIFRDIPGVKVILDNHAVAMTGAQRTPTTCKDTGFDLPSSLKSQGVIVFRVNAYRGTDIRNALHEAISLTSDGVCCAVIVEGECLAIARSASRAHSRLRLNESECVKCGLCNICPAIEFTSGNYPKINQLCSLCGTGQELCVQACKQGALNVRPKIKTPQKKQHQELTPEFTTPKVITHNNQVYLPEDFRMVVCGVGGQGNLFFGRLLAEVLRPLLKPDQNLLQGEIHGMAQKGGIVSSTFCFGNVHSPIFASESVNLLVGMERNEVQRRQYLKLLRPDAQIVFQDLEIRTKTSDDPVSPQPEPGSLLQKWQHFSIDPKEIIESGSQPNVYLIGVIANLSPFNGIPDSVWKNALRKLSKAPSQFMKNHNSFHTGRYHSRVSLQLTENGVCSRAGVPRL